MVEMVKKVGQLFVGNLRKVEKETLEEIDAFMYTIEKKIIELQIMSKKLTANIQAKPHPSMFKLISSDSLKVFQTFSYPVEYILTDIQPQEMYIENMFGKPPVLKIGFSKIKTSSVSYITCKF